MNTKYTNNLFEDISYTQIVAIISLFHFCVEKDVIIEAFDLNEDNFRALTARAKELDCLEKRDDNLYKFSLETEKIERQNLSPEDFSKFLYSYYKNSDISSLQDDLEAVTEKLLTLKNSDIKEVVVTINKIGLKAEQNHNIDLAMLFYRKAVRCSEKISSQKNLFIRSVLNISKLEFMRGLSPYETMQYQQKALRLVNEGNLTAEDALLMVYAGIGRHFAGDTEEGYLLRKKGIDYLKQFDNKGIDNEVMPLIGWHYYLLGDFKSTVAHYESMVLAIESRRDVDIITFAYPPIIFSYFFLGEFSKALILNEIIYRQALENKDYLAATLLYAISGRVHIYMNDIENAEAILYKAYAESIQINYGWAKYYTLFGLCFLHLKKGNIKGSREALELAINVSREHEFGSINASPFVLDVLKLIEEQGLEYIYDLRYENELNQYIASQNIHMAGVAYRHLALLKKEKKENIEDILGLLKKSKELLESSGNNEETAKTCIETALILDSINNREKASAYAELAWKLTPSNERGAFPNELINLVTTEEYPIDFSVMLETAWLEFRHIINPERLVTRILTYLGRLIKTESGAFVNFYNGTHEVLVLQNIDQENLGSAQYQRMMGIVSHTAENKLLFMDFDRDAVKGKISVDLNIKPKFILSLPFLREGKVVAVLYLESYYKNEALTQKECSNLMEFAGNMADHLLATLSYGAPSQKSNKKGDFWEEITKEVTDEKYCVSIDETISLIQAQIRKVAKSHIPVLLTGETGVGKEVFAKEIYSNSNHKASFIKVNCGAIPETLIESELFGYERGSFTGATQRKKGYFEMADGGTIFLDEIGELPLPAQVKLLRVLQEHELMRVGGTESIKVNFRLIAATNKDLGQEAELGTFRQDLYYRLNVIQLAIPSLRNRKADIPKMAKFFVEKFCKELGVETYSIHQDSLMWMINYDWPGNVRELENTIQRAVLLTDGNEIILDACSGKKGSASISGEKILTLEEVERKHILKVLAHCKGKLSGKDGAAELLGVKRTTLISRMERLGLKKRSDASDL